MSTRKVRVTLTSAIDQNLTLIQRSGIDAVTSSGLTVQSSPLGSSARVPPLKAGRTATVELTLRGTSSNPNAAQGKSATASSSSNDQQTAAAVDGDAATRWAANQNADNWIQVDLGATYPLTRVDLAWEDSYARGYKIQTSPGGSSWTDVYTQTAGDGGVDPIDLSARTRSVRVQGTPLSGQWGYSLYELKAFGAPAG